MHEHEGLFCKTVILWIMSNFADPEKNITWAETCWSNSTGEGCSHWANRPKGKRSGGPADLGRGDAAHADAVNGDGRGTGRPKRGWASREAAAAGPYGTGGLGKMVAGDTVNASAAARSGAGDLALGSSTLTEAEQETARDMNCTGSRRGSSGRAGSRR